MRPNIARFTTVALICFCACLLQTTTEFSLAIAGTEAPSEPHKPIGYIAKSQFGKDDDGWRIANTRSDRQFTPSHIAKNGNSDGHLSHPDRVGHSTWYWQAPSKFLGNVTRAYGAVLSFDLKQTSVDSQFDGPDVVLSGQDIKLAYNTAKNPDTTWTAYHIALHESAGWTNQKTKLATTRREMLTVLSALDKLWIRGEYRVGGDTGGLDNVSLAKFNIQRLAQTNEGQPRAILLDLDRQSALVSEWVPIEVFLVNERNEITLADRPYLIRLDVPGGTVDPAEVTIPQGSHAAESRISAAAGGEFPVRAASEPRLPAIERTYTACEKGEVEALAVTADKSGAPADNQTPIHLRIALISKSGTRISDGTAKEIELVPVNIGRLHHIEPQALAPNECVQTARLVSGRPGKATVKASVGAFSKERTFHFYQHLSLVLLMTVLGGGLLGALARAIAERSESQSWPRYKWAAALFSGVIGGLCLFLSYHSGMVSVLPQLPSGPVPALLLGLVGGYLGLLVLDRLGSHLLPPSKPSGSQKHTSEAPATVKQAD